MSPSTCASSERGRPERPMLKQLVKRAALQATVAVGRLQARAGERFPRYGSFWRRAAGYASFAMAGEAYVPEHARSSNGAALVAGPPPEPAPPPPPVPTPAARGLRLQVVRR